MNRAYFFHNSIDRSLIVVCFTGEQTVTISVVIPTVLYLNSHLSTIKESAHFCRGLVTASTSKSILLLINSNVTKTIPMTYNHFKKKTLTCHMGKQLA